MANKYLKQKLMQDQLMKHKNSAHKSFSGDIYQMTSKPPKILNTEHLYHDYKSSAGYNNNNYDSERTPIMGDTNNEEMQQVNEFWSPDKLDIPQGLPFRPDLMNLPLDLYRKVYNSDNSKHEDQFEYQGDRPASHGTNEQYKQSYQNGNHQDMNHQNRNHHDNKRGRNNHISYQKLQTTTAPNYFYPQEASFEGITSTPPPTSSFHTPDLEDYHRESVEKYVGTGGKEYETAAEKIVEGYMGDYMDKYMQEWYIKYCTETGQFCDQIKVSDPS